MKHDVDNLFNKANNVPDILFILFNSVSRKLAGR